MARQLNPTIVIKNTGPKHVGTVFFFHGSGSTAEEIRCGLAAVLGKDFSFPHLKVILPTAPLQPYTPLNGELSNVWFDRLAISSSVPEQTQSVNEIQPDIENLIKQENDLGIPNSRIIVAGFSMGGALSFYAGYKWNTSLAGVVAISSYINKGSMIFEHLKKTETPLPKLLQFHGARDDLVPLTSGKEAFDQLTSYGVDGEFVVDKDADHECTKLELLRVKSWIHDLIPIP